MSVAIHVGDDVTDLGSGDVVRDLFNAISEHLEPDGWGTRFPTLMGPLYKGGLGPDDVPVAHAELRAARTGLSATDAGPFATSDGEDLVAVIDAALTAAERERVGVSLG